MAEESQSASATSPSPGVKPASNRPLLHGNMMPLVQWPQQLPVQLAQMNQMAQMQMQPMQMVPNYSVSWPLSHFDVGSMMKSFLDRKAIPDNKIVDVLLDQECFTSNEFINPKFVQLLKDNISEIFQRVDYAIANLPAAGEEMATCIDALGNTSSILTPNAEFWSKLYEEPKYRLGFDELWFVDEKKTAKRKETSEKMQENANKLMEALYYCVFVVVLYRHPRGSERYKRFVVPFSVFYSNYSNNKELMSDRDNGMQIIARKEHEWFKLFHYRNLFVLISAVNPYPRQKGLFMKIASILVEGRLHSTGGGQSFAANRIAFIYATEGSLFNCQLPRKRKLKTSESAAIFNKRCYVEADTEGGNFPFQDPLVGKDGEGGKVKGSGNGHDADAQNNTAGAGASASTSTDGSSAATKGAWAESLHGLVEAAQMVRKGKGQSAGSSDTSGQDGEGKGSDESGGEEEEHAVEDGEGGSTTAGGSEQGTSSSSDSPTKAAPVPPHMKVVHPQIAPVVISSISHPSPAVVAAAAAASSSQMLQGRLVTATATAGDILRKHHYQRKTKYQYPFKSQFPGGAGSMGMGMQQPLQMPYGLPPGVTGVPSMPGAPGAGVIPNAGLGGAGGVPMGVDLPSMSMNMNMPLPLQMPPMGSYTAPGGPLAQPPTIGAGAGIGTGVGDGTAPASAPGVTPGKATVVSQEQPMHQLLKATLPGIPVNNVSVPAQAPAQAQTLASATGPGEKSSLPGGAPASAPVGIPAFPPTIPGPALAPGLAPAPGVIATATATATAAATSANTPTPVLPLAATGAASAVPKEAIAESKSAQPGDAPLLPLSDNGTAGETGDNANKVPPKLLLQPVQQQQGAITENSAVPVENGVQHAATQDLTEPLIAAKLMQSNPKLVPKGKVMPPGQQQNLSVFQPLPGQPGQAGQPSQPPPAMHPNYLYNPTMSKGQGPLRPGQTMGAQGPPQHPLQPQQQQPLSTYPSSMPPMGMPMMPNIGYGQPGSAGGMPGPLGPPGLNPSGQPGQPGPLDPGKLGSGSGSGLGSRTGAAAGGVTSSANPKGASPSTKSKSPSMQSKSPSMQSKSPSLGPQQAPGQVPVPMPGQYNPFLMPFNPYNPMMGGNPGGGMPPMAGMPHMPPHMLPLPPAPQQSGEKTASSSPTGSESPKDGNYGAMSQMSQMQFQQFLQMQMIQMMQMGIPIPPIMPGMHGGGPNGMPSGMPGAVPGGFQGTGKTSSEGSQGSVSPRMGPGMVPGMGMGMGPGMVPGMGPGMGPRMGMSAGGVPGGPNSGNISGLFPDSDVNEKKRKKRVPKTPKGLSDEDNGASSDNNSRKAKLTTNNSAGTGSASGGADDMNAAEDLLFFLKGSSSSDSMAKTPTASSSSPK